MTCLLNLYGRISNLDTIVQFLTQRDNFSLDSLQSSDEFKGDESAVKANEAASRAEKRTANWFDSFHLSISPCGNLLVIANENSFVICHGKWDLNNQMRYNITSKIALSETEKNEFITSILCLPIASQRISGEGILDWTCIIVGFNTGNIRMYTENGTLLITQMFHDERVIKLKCRTYEQPKYLGWIAQPEEIEILYGGNVLVCLEGANLYHYLRAARKYAANKPGENEMLEMISSLTLDYKKWRLDSQELLTDFVSAGLTSDTLFDQLFAASMIGGPNEKFESIPPLFNRYIACGQLPFVTSYCAFQDMSPPVLAEVKAVAGKITSSFMNAAKGWIGFGKSQPANVKPKPKIEPPTSLTARTNMVDHRRNGERIIVAPANNLAATADSFARVILFDVLKGIAVRVFKGYRDAQIAWMCVEDESDSRANKKYALYLIIYAPRRGLLEVWGCQQGVRVAAFNVGKNATLIYPGYFMLSLNGALLNNQQKSGQIQCFLLTADGLVKTLHIPFHLILSDKSNQRVRDTILLKKIKSVLRENTSETEKVWKDLETLLKDFKIASIKQQAMEKIINTSYLSPERIKSTFLIELEKINKHDEDNSVTPEFQKLREFIVSNCTLISSYIYITKTAQEIEADTRGVSTEKIGELSDMIQIEESDLSDYFALKNIMLTKSAAKKSVKFEESSSVSRFHMELSKYLSSFQTKSTHTSFQLAKSLSLADKQQLGSFIFSSTLRPELTLDSQFQEHFLELIPLSKLDLLDILVAACLGSSSFKLIHSVTNLYTLIGWLSDLNRVDKKPIDDNSQEEPAADTTTTSVDVNFVEAYLHKLKSACETTSNLASSLLLCWIIRSLLFKSQLGQSEMDTLNTLIDRLYSLVKLCILFQTSKKPVIELIEPGLFSLKGILSKNKGILSEITARHVVINELPAKLLTLLDDDDKETTDIAQSSAKSKIIDDASVDLSVILADNYYKTFYDNLQEARKYLPKSLEPDILLVNCAWESIKAYNRDTELHIKHLETSLRYCGEIGNAILKQGILSLIWHNYLSKRVRLLTELLDKTGKLPKDRMMRKEVGINEDTLLQFLECIMTSLDLLMDANCSINEVPIFNYDQFWKDHVEYGDMNLIPTNMFLSLGKSETTSTSSDKLSSINNSNKPLVEIASDQKHINYHLCLFQYQIVRILYLIQKYNLKSVRPLSFFDTKGIQALFSELHTHPLISSDADIKILNARKLFFTKAMNAIMDDVENPTSIKSKLSKDVVDNLNIVFNLAKDMGVDFEYIKRYYCCMLYALDYHSEAEKILHTIKESEILAAQLLTVVGYKLNQMFSHGFGASLVAILSTNLNSWLRSLGSSDYRIYTINTTKKPLLELMGIVLNKLPDTYSEYKIAVELFDFIENPQFNLI